MNERSFMTIFVKKNILPVMVVMELTISSSNSDWSHHTEPKF